MDKNDLHNIRVSDIAEAIVLLTRIPVKLTQTRGVDGAWAWPLSGLAVGVVGAVVAYFGLWLGTGAGIAAGLALAAMMATTGAMHEDGLADCADGFWGAHTAERRLEIMKDSRIGTYGVLALVLASILRWAAMASLFDQGYVMTALVGVAVLSRVPMVAVMSWIEPARKTGLSGTLGRPEDEQVWLSLIAALLISLFFVGFATVGLAVIGAAAAYGVAKLARHKVGGQTGDVLGATQQVAEIAMLAGLVAMWG